jgi:predicted ArsR family transcriptional regulator
MCQARVFSIINRSKRPLTIKEMAKRLGVKDSNVRRSCQRLRHFNEVDVIIKDSGGRPRYWFKKKDQVKS